MPESRTLLDLPSEIRTLIFRHIAVSPYSYPTSAHILPRPLVSDGQIIPVGYFPKDAIIPLLLLGRAVHDDLATILYGENVFVIHISGLELHTFQQRSLGLQVFAERYRPLIRKLWVVTGYGKTDFGVLTWPEALMAANRHTTSRRSAVTTATGTLSKATITAILREEEELALEAMRWVFHEDLYGIGVNSSEQAAMNLPGRKFDCDAKRDRRNQRRQKRSSEFLARDGQDWPASLCFLWQLVMTQGKGTEPRREFRRVAWS